jgi:hypothetical protein
MQRFVEEYSQERTHSFGDSLQDIHRHWVCYAMLVRQPVYGADDVCETTTLNDSNAEVE